MEPHMPIPTTMRIALTEEAGVPASIVTQPVPAVLAGEVLVRIEASGVNPLDLKIFSGKAPHARHPFPAVLGLDLAGSVEALGAGVHHLQEGDAVFGMTGPRRAPWRSRRQRARLGYSLSGAPVHAGSNLLRGIHASAAAHG